MFRTARFGAVVLAMGLSVAASPTWCAPVKHAAEGGGDLITIEKAMSGPYVKRAFVVANSVADWDAAMAILGSAQALQITPPPPAPDVDWTREVIVLAAAGFTGYDATLELSPGTGNTVSLGVVWTPLGNDASWAMPYHLVRTAKRGWLKSQVEIGDDVLGALPISGIEEGSVPAVAASWGGVKALYR